MFRKINLALTTFVLVLLVGLIFLFFNLKTTPAGPAASGRLRVVATFFPLYDFAKNIGQDRIDLQILFTQTPEIASFTPADIQKINQADLLIKNGVGFEPILDELIAGSDNQKLGVVDTSIGVKILASDEEEHPLGDPHIWLDPQNAIVQAANIRDGLVKYDPENADFYRENATNYLRKLQELDNGLAQEIKTFKQSDFVAFHPAFNYFARRYGLNQAAVFEESPGKEPSPRYLAEVIKTIKRLNVTALFAEPQFSPKVMEAVARDLGLQIRSLDPLETGDAKQDSYISLMKKNLQTLNEVLRR